MANWRHRLEINSLFNNGVPDPIDEPEEFATLREKVAAELERSRLFPAPYVTTLRKVGSTKGFETALNSIYNYADANLIWMGL